MENKEKAINDFNVIKEALDNTKKNSQPIRKIFLVYGLLNTFLLVVQFITNLFIQDSSVLSIISPLATVIMYFLTAVLLVRISSKEKRQTNIFYRLFIAIFLFVSVLLPMIFLLTRTYAAFTGIGNNEILISFYQMNEFLAIFLFTISLFLIGSITENRIFTGLSNANVLIYLILFTSGNSVIITQEQMISAQYSAIYSSVITSIGYILLAFLLYNKDRKSRL